MACSTRERWSTSSCVVQREPSRNPRRRPKRSCRTADRRVEASTWGHQSINKATYSLQKTQSTAFSESLIGGHAVPVTWSLTEGRVRQWNRCSSKKEDDQVPVNRAASKTLRGDNQSASLTASPLLSPSVSNPCQAPKGESRRTASACPIPSNTSPRMGEAEWKRLLAHNRRSLSETTMSGQTGRPRPQVGAL